MRPHSTRDDNIAALLRIVTCGSARCLRLCLARSSLDVDPMIPLGFVVLVQVRVLDCVIVFVIVIVLVLLVWPRQQRVQVCQLYSRQKIAEGVEYLQQH